MRKIIIPILILLFPVLLGFTAVPEIPVKVAKSRIEVIQQSAFTPALLLEYLGTKYKGYFDVVLRQFILETGWFKSDRFLTKNNISGMKFPAKRKTTACGKDSKGYAVYAHWTDSVDDYFLWLQYHMDKGKDSSDMYSFLVRANYCPENSNYIKILKGIKLSRLCQ